MGCKRQTRSLFFRHPITKVSLAGRRVAIRGFDSNIFGALPVQTGSSLDTGLAKEDFTPGGELGDSCLYAQIFIAHLRQQLFANHTIHFGDFPLVNVVPAIERRPVRST